MRTINVIVILAILFALAGNHESVLDPVADLKVNFEQGKLAQPNAKGKVVTVYYLGQKWNLNL